MAALILVQMLMGVVTAHYGVEGDGLYGVKISGWLPYSVTRTWHVQLGIFWIATSWLASKAALLSAAIYLSGGIIGTCHRLSFSGTPTVALAWGAAFSALEVVPLVLVASSALDDLRRGQLTRWAERYKWPICFFLAVAFRNMVGAGLFGFMINPPIALYFMQGLNATPVDGHAALFGVYGILGIGLMLVCLRALAPEIGWKEKLLKFGFWSMNAGLMAMCVGSLLPVGLPLTWASVDHGYWYARSADFLGTPVIQTLRWLRVPGDTVFAIGELALVLFVFTIFPRRSARSEPVLSAARTGETAR